MPIIPIADQNPTLVIHKPWVTWGLIATCVAMFWVQSLSGDQGGLELIYGLGVIPSTLVGQASLPPEIALLPPVATLGTHGVLHGSMMHLVSNMLFLWVFGDNVEDAMGHLRFFVFYMICGSIAALSHVLWVPLSHVPMIGASGAISGVLGAYLLLHPRAKVLVPIYFIPITIPAWLMLLGWIGLQFYSVVIAPHDPAGGGVAWLSHIGGFIAGLLLVTLFRNKTLPLLGRDDLPSGLTLRDRARWQNMEQKRQKR